MIQYPLSDTVTPLIVVGPQRCGTRFVTNMLNSIPGVVLQGEIPEAIMNKIVSLIKKTDGKYLNDERAQIKDNWTQSRQSFMYAVWSHVAKGKKKDINSKSIFYGYKSPFHEQYFDFYNSFFHPIHPKYVCCVRSFTGHYFSVQARWPYKSIFRVAHRYVQSMKKIRYMKETRPDDVQFFFLDEYKKQGFEYLNKKVFKQLGLHEVDKAKKKAAKGPANASAQLGLKKRHQLRTLEALFLRAYPQPITKYEALFRDFG